MAPGPAKAVSSKGKTGGVKVKDATKNKRAGKVSIVFSNTNSRSPNKNHACMVSILFRDIQSDGRCAENSG